MASFLLLNGGVGSRIGSDQPKQLIRINEIPIFIYSLRVVDELEFVTEVVMNYPTGWKEEIQRLVELYAIQTPIKYVSAGRTRQESVQKMLNEVTESQLYIHESARPMVTVRDFVLLKNSEYQNATLTLPVPFTVLCTNSDKTELDGVLDRETLVNIQLPQKFLLKDLVAAHEEAEQNKQTFTEDAAMVFQLGSAVGLVQGNDANFKVTTPNDVLIAEYMLGKLGEQKSYE